MKIRIFAMLVLLALLLPLWIPGSVQAVQEETLEQSIQRQIEEYALSLYSDTTPGAGKSVLLRHAIFGGGKDLIVDDESQLTAAFMNSVVLQECLRYSCANMIRYMQDANLDVLYGSGNTHWYKSYCSYGAYAYLNEIPVGPDRGGDLVGGAASSFALYGRYQFDTPLNDCDEALITVIGNAAFIMYVSRVDVQENTAVYRVTVTVFDDFDFNGNYDDSDQDMSLDKELAEIGGSLASWLINPFRWESTAVFTLEVPYSCDHSYGNYQWTLDSKSRQLVNDTSEGLTPNGASLIPYGSAKYYRLDKPVQLRHDAPWILEYDISGNASFSMGALDSYATAVPFFDHWANDLVLIGRYRQTLISESPETKYANENYRYGAELAYDYEAGHTYTYRYENRIAEDGTNMIWVCVADKTTGQQVVAPAPMNGFYMITDEGMTDQDAKTDWLSGKDISICYVGSKSAYNTTDGFALRIWTNGEEGTNEAAFQDGYIQPTCTEYGGKAQVCALCGYYELTEPEEPLGHRFGEYVSNMDADCVNDGTKTAECKVCGVEDTVVDEGSVYGHEFRKYYSDNNATCTSDGTKTAKCKYCDVTDTVPEPGTMLPHSYEAVITPPACTEAGYTTHTCTCADSYVDSHTDALGHELGDWETVRDANHLENGVKVRHCSRCEVFESEEISNNPFPDVGDGHSFKTYILWNYYNGIVGGDKQGYFNPDQTVTRGQFILMLWRAAGEPEPAQYKAFPDVSAHSSFYRAVCWAVEQGITNGKQDGNFGVNDPCTRGHVVLFLYRYAGNPEIAGTVSFPDVTGGTYYRAVCWAAENGITSGQSNGTFGVSNPCKRMHVTKFLYLFLNEE